VKAVGGRCHNNVTSFRETDEENHDIFRSILITQIRSEGDKALAKEYAKNAHCHQLYSIYGLGICICMNL
jgi:hypothetical protein